ncbi:hypothetical protein [Lentilactobacillus hilgardii]|uniref:hypothetical protein n=1 Tax=Lentilactobacillus hilgardii TaxID=1588 RepID=UPI0021C2A287|nr:hypothetical protein [Lentilactobacillus hilgardii]MCP9333944.1 hypothetical protein [Lentilactobacillus hilgardii]MCP9350540.1 hypothetical protein [Lentilactobacillus hilgardii]MCP9353436.1 hypothetical protein [Lentilactobacillus hilgardii]MCT3397591.1 hypothetical protein [Lentilactobacillus hilgardii]
MMTLSNFMLIILQVIFTLGTFLLMFISMLLTIGWLDDHQRKEPYLFKTVHTRKEYHESQQIRIYFLNYWVWQSKKKAAVVQCLKDNDVSEVHFQHARKRKTTIRSNMPFKREGFGSPARQHWIGNK